MPLDLATYVHDVALRDGRTVRIRPIRPDDLDAMMEMWSRLSLDTVRLRFFAPRRMEREQMRYFTEVDYTDRFALVAARGDRLIGVSRFDRLPHDPDAAEFAVLVEDAEQGNGVGTVLLRSLLPPAQDLGISNFKGSFLRDNRRMREVLTTAGFEPVFTSVDGTVETSFRAVPSHTFLRSADEQDRRAAVEALRALLVPGAVAVIGASRDPGKIGGMVFAHLCRRFRGTVYPVNPHADEVQGVRAYATVADCPQVPDAIVVCVPPAEVAQVVTDAAQAGSVAAVIITAAGGDEADDDRLDLLDIARSHGIRIVGPASMGVLNATDDMRMNASISDAFPDPGSLAFLSQSGALGLAVLARARALGLGVSSFVSVGAKSDISGNDLLQFWESDDATEVIALYLESFGNPQKFGRIARRVGRSKPIVAVKAGASTRDGRGTAGGWAAYADDAAVDALFAQAGVIRTRTLGELFDVTAVLATQALPAGRRVGIISNGRGPGTLAADACDAAGLEVCELSADTRDRLVRLLPVTTRVDNPVDISPSTPAPAYGDALRAVAADADVDLVLAIFVPPIGTASGDIAGEIAAAREQIDDATPMVSVVMAGTDEASDRRRTAVPTFAFPEDAARALGHVAQYAQWRRRPLGHVVEVTDADVDAARRIVTGALAGTDHRDLDTAGIGDMLRTVGLAVADGAAPGDGVTLRIGVRHDPTFGSVLLVGTHGAPVDLFADVRIRLHPVTDHDVDDMLAELRGFPLLVGEGATPAVDLDDLRNVLFRLNALVDIVDEIDELDLEPVVATADGVHVGGARIRLARHVHRH